MNNLPSVALLLAIVAAITAAAVPVYFGSRKLGYSHLRDTISELGEVGSPLGRSVSIGFLVTGILLWLFAFVASKALPHEPTEVFFLLALVGLGYVGGAIFRCDPGAPLLGSWRNTFHNIFAAFEYVGAAGAFTTLQRSEFWSPLSGPMAYAGGFVLICLCAISFPHPYRGLVQRVAESVIFLGVILMGWWVYRADV